MAWQQRARWPARAHGACTRDVGRGVPRGLPSSVLADGARGQSARQSIPASCLTRSPRPGGGPGCSCAGCSLVLLLSALGYSREMAAVEHDDATLQIEVVSDIM